MFVRNLTGLWVWHFFPIAKNPLLLHFQLSRKVLFFRCFTFIDSHILLSKGWSLPKRIGRPVDEPDLGQEACLVEAQVVDWQYQVLKKTLVLKLLHFMKSQPIVLKVVQVQEVLLGEGSRQGFECVASSTKFLEGIPNRNLVMTFMFFKSATWLEEFSFPIMISCVPWEHFDQTLNWFSLKKD